MDSSFIDDLVELTPGLLNNHHAAAVCASALAIRSAVLIATSGLSEIDVIPRFTSQPANSG
jgi:hypothetical protein